MKSTTFRVSLHVHSEVPNQILAIATDDADADHTVEHYFSESEANLFLTHVYGDSSQALSLLNDLRESQQLDVLADSATFVPFTIEQLVDYGFTQALLQLTSLTYDLSIMRGSQPGTYVLEAKPNPPTPASPASLPITKWSQMAPILSGLTHTSAARLEKIRNDLDNDVRGQEFLGPDDLQDGIVMPFQRGSVIILFTQLLASPR